MATGPTAWKVGLNEAQLRAGSWPVLQTLLLVLGTTASICLLDRFYVLIALSMVWAPYVFFHPREGLWVAPSFILVASLTSPPEAFVWGVGYSPELVYWAIGICVLFVTMLIRYVHAEEKSGVRARSLRKLIPPRGAYAFAAISVIAAVIGVAHGFALQNVAKQFFGCVLLCGYFFFALRFAPAKEDIEQVIDRIVYVAVICSLIYIALFFSLFSEESFSSHLTVLSTYNGGLVVLLLPRIFRDKIGVRIDRTVIVALILFAVPVLAQFKRAVVACVLCVFLAWGLRSGSRRRRYIYLATAFLVFALMLSTSLLNPIGAWFSKHSDLENFLPEDVQSHYSVFLRVQEFRQVMDSLGSVPVFGTGLGSTITWFDPLAKVYWDQETLDIGWLYLLAKMGIVGTAAFIWFIGPLSTAALRKRVSGLHLALLLLLVFHLVLMIADASFVYFMTAGWEGTACAFLYIMNNCESRTPELIPHLA
jgi:hypothetical protein